MCYNFYERKVPMANYELSNRIYELRTQKGLSQKELGAILGVSNKAVSKWETGTAIPKTETLIKLAEVFGISTEELINIVCKGEESQSTNMQDEKDGPVEMNLEQLNVGVEKTDKPIKNLKAYFFKTSLIWYIILVLILSAPVSISAFITPILSGLSGTMMRDVLDILVDVITVVINIMYCNMFAKYIIKKTELNGDIFKYRYLYYVIPSGVVAGISILSGLVTTLAYTTIIDDATKSFLLPVAGGINIVLSVVSVVLVALVMASLLNTAIVSDAERKIKTHKIMAVIVTVSCVLALALTIFANTLEMYPIYDTIIRRIFIYGVYIAIAWLVCFVKNDDQKKGEIVFTILPLISILDSLVYGLFSL